MPELLQSQLPLPLPPQISTQAYRPPRAVNYDEDQEAEEGEERWSDTHSESEKRKNETATPRGRPFVAENVNATTTRHRPWYRITQHHHRSNSWDLDDNNGGYTGDPLWSYPTPNTGSGRSGPGGQAIRYPRDLSPHPSGDAYFNLHPGREQPHPFAPISQHPPQPTQYGASHGRFYTDHHPMPSYHTNPPFADPRLYRTPPYLPNSGSYPRNSNGADLYPAHPPTANTYSENHGLYGPNSNTVNPPPIVPLYHGIPHPLQPANGKAYVIDPEVESLKREIHKLKIRDKRREEEQREKEEAASRKQDQEERVHRRERRRRQQEKLKLQAESQSRRKMEAKTHHKKKPVDQESDDEYVIDDEISKKKIERLVADAIEHMADGRSDGEIALRKKGLQDNRIDKTEHVFDAIKDIIERLQRQERPSFEERSVGTSLEGRRRLAVVPFEPTVDVVTRTQIESIVYDVLQRLGVTRQIQETTFAWNKSTVASERPGQENQSAASLRPPDSAFEPRYNSELEAQVGSQLYRNYENRQSDVISPGSQGPSSGYTAVNNSDRSSPLQSKEDFIRLRTPSGPKNGFERRNNVRVPPPRVITSATMDDYVQIDHDQANRGNGYRPTNNSRDEPWIKSSTSTRFGENGGHTTPIASMGNKMPRMQSEMESMRRKRRDMVVPDTDDSGRLSSDESEEKNIFPNRSRQYLGKPPHGSRRHRVGSILPPTVPDAPQGKSNHKRAGRQANVVTDVEA